MTNPGSDKCAMKTIPSIPTSGAGHFPLTPSMMGTRNMSPLVRLESELLENAKTTIFIQQKLTIKIAETIENTTTCKITTMQIPMLPLTIPLLRRDDEKLSNTVNNH
jgi:hypothetical protein